MSGSELPPPSPPSEPLNAVAAESESFEFLSSDLDFLSFFSLDLPSFLPSSDWSPLEPPVPPEPLSVSVSGATYVLVDPSEPLPETPEPPELLPPFPPELSVGGFVGVWGSVYWSVAESACTVLGAQANARINDPRINAARAEICPKENFSFV